MSSVLLSSEGYGTSLKAFGVRFSIEYEEDLTIAGSDKTANVKYLRESLPEEAKEEVSEKI